MKKSVIIIIMIGMMVSLLTGCKHEHTWQDATCLTPKTCTECGETEGDPLGHDWLEATCTDPQKCSRCGETQGEALSHDWLDATCTLPVTCSRCGETAGNPLGHTWVDATCTKSKYCSVCFVTEGEPLGHNWTEATHEAPKTCTVCGETEGEPLYYDIPEGFTEDFSFAEFSTYNSPASENGLGDTPVWTIGKYDKVNTLDTYDEDVGATLSYFALFTDEDNNTWLIFLDNSYFEKIDKYVAMEGHSICIKGLYMGYSEVYKAPAIQMQYIFDRNTGNTIISALFTYE